jgi:hypothetical protein
MRLLRILLKLSILLYFTLNKNFFMNWENYRLEPAIKRRRITACEVRLFAGSELCLAVIQKECGGKDSRGWREGFLRVIDCGI